MALFQPLQTLFGTHAEDNFRVGPTFEAALQPNPAVPNTINYATIGRPGAYTSPIFVYDVKPAATTGDALVTAQIIAAAGYLPLRAVPGGGVTTAYTPANEQVWMLDIPRTINIIGTDAGVTAANYTIWGYDEYGFPVCEQVNHAGGAVTATSKKALKAVRRIYCSAGTTAAITVGTSNVFGLPYKLPSSAELIKASFNNFDWVYGTTGVPAASFYSVVGGALATSGTLQVADATNPATLITGDVRGTVTPSTAADGNMRLSVAYYVSGQDNIYLELNSLTSEVASTQALLGAVQFNQNFT